MCPYLSCIWICTDLAFVSWFFSCKGQRYRCQSSYPSSSCIRTSECVGDGSCRDIMRTNGTVCQSAVDMCDQPEK